MLKPEQIARISEKIGSPLTPYLHCVEKWPKASMFPSIKRRILSQKKSSIA